MSDLHTLKWCPVAGRKVGWSSQVSGQPCPHCPTELPKSGDRIESAERPHENAAIAEEVVAGRLLNSGEELLRVVGQDNCTRFLAKYRGGLPDEPNTENVANKWAVVVGPLGICVAKGLFYGRLEALVSAPGQWEIKAFDSWEDLLFLRIRSEGNERVNKGALAAFGLLSVGATIQLTAITVGFADADVRLEADGGVFGWESALAEVAGHNPLASAKVTLKADATAPAPNDEVGVRNERDIVSKLESLAGLFEKGLIDRGEYDRLKSDLLESGG